MSFGRGAGDGRGEEGGDGVAGQWEAVLVRVQSGWMLVVMVVLAGG